MKLVSARVQNYKCIDDSGEFSIAGLTCLAGKNESGKTALLQALRRLNPVEETEEQFDPLTEYPRRRQNQPQRGGPKEVLTTKWEMSQDDIKAVEPIVGPSAIQNPMVIINKGYDNLTDWVFDFGELFLNEDTSDAVRIELEKRLPRFLYFPTYGTLPGRVSVEQIADKVDAKTSQNDGERLFLALLALAGTNVDELRNADRSEGLIARLEGVSNQLSDEIFQYWTQNRNLEVGFSYHEARPNDPEPFNSGHIFNLRVRNNTHRVSIGFDERSTGFVWFFSFLVWFSQMEQIYGDRLVILLDEPGLSLHGKAQGDLLQYIKEKLLPKYQVIYTTHSPFMIDTEAILSVRTVEDVVTKDGVSMGTKVGDQVLSADADTIFPLRAALGYDITQSLFIGEHSLLVEGPSDLMFLRWASKQLITRGRTGLDDRWTITPVGGIDKLGSFVALFAGNELHVAVLTDFHSGDKRKVRDLKESEILSSGHVFTADSFANQIEADIEDILGRDLYVKIVNRCYELKEKKRVPKVRPDNATELVLEEVKQHFRTVATEERGFDHLSPAVYLFENASEFHNAKGVDTALDRFEKFFRAVNGLLPNPSGL